MMYAFCPTGGVFITNKLALRGTAAYVHRHCALADLFKAGGQRTKRTNEREKKTNKQTKREIFLSAVVAIDVVKRKLNRAENVELKMFHSPNVR